MSEPVGNGPRSKKLDSIAGNSHKDREAASKPEEKEEVVQVVTGKVVVKKKNVLQRFTSKMIAEDARNVGDYILDDILLPAVKNLILDVINSGSSRMLLGSGARRHASSQSQQSGGSGIRTKYSNIPVDNRARGRVVHERHDLETIAVEDRQEAYAIIDALIERCQRYGVATVSDFYAMCGVTGDYTARSWGWDNLQSADVRMRGGMYYFDLPDPQPIRR